MTKHTHSNETFVTLITVINLLLICALAVWTFSAWTQLQSAQQAQQNSTPTITSTTYSCDKNKTIQAVYFNNTVELQLSDKRNLLLIQAISGSGVRFTNSDESITFWNKGNTAFIEEGPQNTVTYNDCTQTTQ